ncbi:MAG: hypothetical protein BWY24_00338 [Microgenomates group bacterium ADurb.Bin219]|nr:MAG: hypothetical protein BWY24_00338 [Microgenomates group bacterium ADurb.Bin219]
MRKENETKPIFNEFPDTLYSFSFSSIDEKTKVKKMIGQWQDKAVGRSEGSSQSIIILYAGENHERDPVAFIAEENGVLRLVVIGRTVELAEKHRQTIAQLVKYT